MSSNAATSKRGPPRGGGGRGRGRGGGGRRSGRGRSSKRSNEKSNGNSTVSVLSNNGPASTSASTNGANQSDRLPELRDEEVLIAFMPYLKGDNMEAMSIHELYQANNDQQALLKAARDFLSREQNGVSATTSHLSNKGENTPRSLSNQHSLPSSSTSNAASNAPEASTSQITRQDPFQTHMVPQTFQQNHTETTFSASTPNEPSSDRHQHEMEALERNMADLLSDDDDDPLFGTGSNTLPPHQHQSVSSIGGTAIGSSPSPHSMGSNIYHTSSPSPHDYRFHHLQQQQHSMTFQQFNQPISRNPITPPRASGMPPPPTHSTGMSSPSAFESLFPPNNRQNSNNGHSPLFQPQQHPHTLHQLPPQGIHHQRSYSPQSSSGTSAWSNVQPPTYLNSSSNRTPPEISQHQQQPPPEHHPNSSALPSPAPIGREPSKQSDTTTGGASVEATKAPSKKEYQPKRLWTRLEEQPGKLIANNVQASMGAVVDLRPRQELKAQWMLPLTYLRQHAAGKEDVKSVRDLLQNLAVGLFRRGCTENGSQASIVSKEILSPPGESRSDYQFKVVNEAVVGTVPFFAPRTPGHVVFRMYWQDEPLHTLATGPTLNVRVTEHDFESSIRFILSNFKAKKVNPTSLSPLNSLALVLEQFHLPNTNHQQGIPQQLEGAGRAVWGCICEARKVLDACASEYHKTTAKLQKLEEVVEELKGKVEEEEREKEISSNDDTELLQSEEEERSENLLALREKQKALMSGRASCERKWRDSQLAFASILRSIVTNPSMSVILRRELIAKLRLEFELWCPLSEEFAVPGDSDSKMWYEPLANLPHSITADHYSFCNDARSKMQQKSLGFDPNTSPMDNILYPNRGNNRQMNPGAVTVFNQLSAAMGQLYQENFATADRIIQQREMIRLKTEKLVSLCDGFPPGTKVAIFGSSANGFGSPKSDLDMCLQIPQGLVITDEDDPTGSAKMAELAKVLEENGMLEVDTARLTARIPVIKFNCPKPLHDGLDGEESTMECDLSMHNPLAVLNTSLLRTYAEINPVPRVLAGVIKRWAKARDINNPARHTLSSYGYILMLLHFLTFHQRSGNGLVTTVARTDKSQRSKILPLLPNLQWMDERWPEMTPGTPYSERGSLPEKTMQHPQEEHGSTNIYFYRPNAAMLQNLQQLFPGQDLSLGILLASFFRYYAYEFDYKRNVVSLHSTIAHGLIEREVKAELDGWRNYSAALTIEDPFETFYDVAHVLRGGYYHRIRREFAVAYTKIADVASGKTTSTWNNKTVDLTKMVGMELIDWICEPISNERDDASSQP